MQDRKAEGALAPAAPSGPTPLAPTSWGGFESWVWGFFFYTNKGTKCTKVFGGVGEERGAPRAHLALEEEGGGHRLPPHLVVVAHHPLDVEEFVAQGFGLQLLRLVVGALKGSTGPASATWALGRGLQPGGAVGMVSTSLSYIMPTQPQFSWKLRPAALRTLTRFRSFSLLYSSATSCEGKGVGGGVTTGGHHGWGPQRWAPHGDKCWPAASPMPCSILSPHSIYS